MRGGHNKFEQMSRGVQAHLYNSFFSLASSDLIIFGLGGGQVGQTNLLIYFYYFICFFKKLICFFCGGEGRSKEYFYLIWLSLKKNIGHL